MTLGLSLGAVGIAAASGTFVPGADATVVSDKIDYAPGETVTLTGDQWWPGAPVRIVVNDDPALNLGADQSWRLDSTAQGIDPVTSDVGTFTFAFRLPDWFIANYEVTATQPNPDGTMRTATATFTDSPGSYTLKWYGADPAIDKAPYLPTYDKLQPAQLPCTTPIRDSGRADGPLADAVAYASPAIPSNLDAVTSLEPKSMVLGQVVPFELEITVSGVVMPENGTIDIVNYFNTYTTSGDDFGFDPDYGLYCAFVDTADPGTTDPGNNARVVSFSDTLESAGTSKESILGSTQITGLDNGDRIIVELWVVLKDTLPAKSTGNVQTGFTSADVVYTNGETGKTTIQLGNQTVPLNNVGSFFTASADLSITKTDSPDPVSAGSPLTYTLTVTNNSTDTYANDIVVTDTYDANTTLVSVTPSQGSCTTATNPFTCALGGLAPGAPATITVVVNVALNAPNNDLTTNPEAGNAGTPSSTFSCTTTPRDLCNVATVTALTDDPNLANNGAAQPTNVLPATDDALDLAVTKTVVPAFTRTYAYTINKEVTGDGTAYATDGTATFDYTVTVGQGGYVDSAFSVSGVITVTNSNTFAVPGGSLSDSLTNANACVIDNSNESNLDPDSFTMPAASGETPATETFDYTCSYTGTPPTSESNTVSLSWTKTFTVGYVTYTTPNSSDSDTKAVAFTTPTTEVDESVTVVDDEFGVINDGNAIAYDDLPYSENYQLTWDAVAGTCTDFTNTATYTTNDNGFTGSDDVTVNVCDYRDLTVTKTAVPSLTRTYDYVVTKDATDHEKLVAEEGSTFDYTVTVTQGEFVDSNWAVTGQITVFNSNTVPVTGVDITDEIGDANAECLVTNGTGRTVPAGGSIVVDYTCTWSEAPAALTQTNTATATWDDFGSPTMTDSGPADVDWSSAVLDEVDETAVLTDSELGTLNGGDPIAWADLPYSETYQLEWDAVAGTCVQYPNTATVYGGDSDDILSQATETVTLCDYRDLTVTKTAVPDLTKTWTWQILKSVDKTSVTTSGSTATFNYTVTLTSSGPTMSDYDVTGTITVSNPNTIDVKGVTITDTILGDSGDTCAVTDGANLTVPAGKSVTVNYTCDFGSNTPTNTTEQTNRATATWDDFGSPTTTANGDTKVTWASAVVTKIDDKVSVTDTHYTATPPWTVTAEVGPNPTQFTYSKTFNVPTAGCAAFPNTATFTTNTTGTTGSSSVTVTVCRSISGGYTMGYWMNKNGQADIKKMGTTVCDALKTNYSAVLGGLDCTTPAKFQSSVMAILKAAEASGTGEPMFIGQFLATALSTYKTPSLGTTHVAVDESLFGASCMTVNELLLEGNAQYATLRLDKTKLMMVKDYYDRINNNKALTC